MLCIVELVGSEAARPWSSEPLIVVTNLRRERSHQDDTAIRNIVGKRINAIAIEKIFNEQHDDLVMVQVFMRDVDDSNVSVVFAQRLKSVLLLIHVWRGVRKI